jgi:SSS family solute:Na+ symporter
MLKIATLDLLIIVVYLLGIVALGCWVGLRRHQGQRSGKDYFLAGTKLTWPVIGLALFSTNISTIHLVSLAQEGFDNGLAYGNFEWMAAFSLIVLALFFAPFYIRSGVATLPDFLEMRYNRACRDWLAILSIISAIFIHIGFSLYTGAVVLRGMLGIDLYVSIAVTATMTGLYTIVGGLMAVVVTESIQAIVLVVGAVCVTGIAYVHVGGWSRLAAAVDPVKLTVLRAADDPSGLPWYSVLLGYPVIGIWYWCADQTIVQRVLGAKDENHARVGPLFAGFIKILPVFIFVLPGLLCLALVNREQLDLKGMQNLEIGQEVVLDGRKVSVAGQDVELRGQELQAGGKVFAIERRSARVAAGVLYLDQKAVKNTQDTYGYMIRQLLPTGLRGLAAAALLAALMGTVSGALNSAATLFSYDLVKRWNPAIQDRQLVLIGRVTTFVAMIAAIVWSPFLGRYGSIFQGINSMISYIAPPITTVFLAGVFWRRASSVAAQATLYVGSTLGLIVFLLDWFREQTGWNIPFMMAAFYLFVFCSALLAMVSLIQPHRHTDASERLVWAQPLDALKAQEAWSGIGDFRILAGLLFLVMVALYWGFR